MNSIANPDNCASAFIISISTEKHIENVTVLLRFKTVCFWLQNYNKNKENINANCHRRTEHFFQLTTFTDAQHKCCLYETRKILIPPSSSEKLDFSMQLLFKMFWFKKNIILSRFLRFNKNLAWNACPFLTP